MTTSLSRMMLNAATSSVIQLTNRTPLRNYTSAFFPTSLKTSITTIRTSNNIPNLIRTTPIPAHHPFSAQAETENSFSSDYDIFKMPEVPKEFPFKIVYNSGEESMMLTREYQGEEIKVKVEWPNHLKYNYGYSKEKRYVCLNVNISKKSGQALEFNVAADEDVIEVKSSLDIKNPNASHDYPANEEPDISDLSEKLQKAFHTYLEVRGFEPGIGKFLCACMANRWCMKYTTNKSRQESRVESLETTSNSDDNFLRVIESEIIDCAEKKLHKVPTEFPFKIEDRTGVDNIVRRDGIIKLTREYQGEEIVVIVHDRSYFFPKNSGRVYVKLVGKVSNGSGLDLEFEVMADSKNGIKINSFSVNNPNASDTDNHSDFDDKVARTYLEVRGIEPGIANILRDCMVKRKHKIYTVWLKHFKNFIAN